MPLIVKDTGGEGQSFDPIPAGMHQAVCYAVIDVGTPPQYGNYPARPKVMISWEIPTERIEVERDGKKLNMPRAISEEYTLSLASKANLRPMLESWRGRPFSEDELKGFDLQKVLGINCLLNVVHARGKGEKANRIYANVASVSPIMKGMAVSKPENPMVFFSMADMAGPVIIPDSIPDWIKKKILQSEEYIQKTAGPASPAHPPSGSSVDGAPDEPDCPF